MLKRKASKSVSDGFASPIVDEWTNPHANVLQLYPRSNVSESKCGEIGRLLPCDCAAVN